MNKLFSNNLSRIELIKLSKSNQNQPIKVQVFRNHSFEPIASTLNAFLNLSGLCCDFHFSSYDDSITLTNIDDCKLNIIFIDTSRYKNNIDSFIEEKIAELKKISSAPIITLLLGDTKLRDYDIQLILKPYLDDIIDESNLELSATRLSNKALIKLSQVLGLSIIPSVLIPSLKAIVCDLDNTLYSGILGEDGYENLVLKENHKSLHKKLLELKQQGFLLAIASKNEEQDAKLMFEKRKDFLIKFDDFDLAYVNWNGKDSNIQEISKKFNIGLDSILFIDDNIAEIENVKYLGVKTLLADDNSSNNLSLYPGILRTTFSKEDSLRSADIKANEERHELSKLSQKEYFENLQIKLSFSINNHSHLQRASQLLNKTNQFISNYSRMSFDSCEEFVKNNAILTIGMSDRLSDSGIIAVFVASKDNDNIIINDLCVSCRALGRKLEKIMFCMALDNLKKYFKANGVLIHFKKGERNSPFLDFLYSLSIEMKDNVVSKYDDDINFEGLEIEGLL